MDTTQEELLRRLRELYRDLQGMKASGAGPAETAELEQEIKRLAVGVEEAPDFHDPFADLWD